MLWITYAWIDNEEGDFTYLVQELKAVGVEATYDKIALVPGRRLWGQIADKIINDPLSGWAYLITPDSLDRETCKEELAYALYRALQDKSASFPLIGLLHGAQIDDVPASLRVRLCVNLAAPDWKEQVLAAVQGRAPTPTITQATRFVWTVHQGYGGDPSHVAIELRTRFESIMHWRFVVPRAASIVNWGVGPPGGGGISGVKTNVVNGGSGTLEAVECTWFGAGDMVSPSVSAYVVFEEKLPEFVAFGHATQAFGPPTDPLEAFRPG